jgi:hypothetical protein
VQLPERPGEQALSANGNGQVKDVVPV